MFSNPIPWELKVFLGGDYDQVVGNDQVADIPESVDIDQGVVFINPWTVARGRTVH